MRCKSSAASVPDGGVLYVDTSALVKLLVEETETDALRAELQRRDVVATSVITEIELARAAARARQRGATALDDVAVWAITAATLELELTPEIRRAAAALQPSAVRSLDAIHLATAASLGDDLAGLLTYDIRMQDAAVALGVTVLAPR
ncbi:MAG TPA: type II toxin-antitoxin system VapC family toxin [Baekduia sp.]